MDRNINTVRAAWLEYTRYIAPLLKDDDVARKWKKSDQAENRFYNRRKPLFSAIHQLMDGNYFYYLQ